MKKATRPKRQKSIFITETKEGETLEKKVKRITENKEPITDGAPIIFTEKKDGVRPEFDIRTDRWVIALNAMDAVNRERIAKSKQYGTGEPKPEAGETKPEAGETKPS